MSGFQIPEGIPATDFETLTIPQGAFPAAAPQGLALGGDRGKMLLALGIAGVALLVLTSGGNRRRR